MDDEQLVAVVVLGGLMAVVAVAALLGAVFWAHVRRGERRRDLWQRVAARVGGTAILQPGSSGELIVPIMGYTVYVTLHLRKSVRSSTTYQRATVMAPDDWHRGAQVARRTALDTVLDAVADGQDVTIGDAPFDRLFVVQSTDPDWLRAVLTLGTRQAHLASPAMRMRLSPVSRRAQAPTTRMPQMFARLAEQAYRDAGHDPEAIRRTRISLGDGVLCVDRPGRADDEQTLLAQLGLVAAYAHDFFGGEGRSAVLQSPAAAPP